MRSTASISAISVQQCLSDWGKDLQGTVRIAAEVPLRSQRHSVARQHDSAVRTAWPSRPLGTGRVADCRLEVEAQHVAVLLAEHRQHAGRRLQRRPAARLPPQALAVLHGTVKMLAEGTAANQ